jgi:MFS family permease
VNKKSFIDKTSNHIKNVCHGFFLGIGTAIAEPSTILPLIVHHFSSSSVLVGLFVSLLRGGAILVQMFAAFYAQSFSYVLPFLKRVFLVRFLSWFSIGFAIIAIGDKHKSLTLFFIGLGLFFFSFSAGFGAIYFRELMGKMFSHKYRGYTMAYRQFFTGLGSILSGAAAGWVLNNFNAPTSYGYLFMISAMFMGIGFFIFSKVDEPKKEKISKKESHFKEFLKNSINILKANQHLQTQIKSYLFSYSYMLSLPFIILQAKKYISLNGTDIGVFISVQMIGAMLSNFIWGKLSSNGKNRIIVTISTFLLIFIITMAAFATDDIYAYYVIFFFFGVATDGLRLAFGNLILILAPEDKRPVYVALQTNIVSLGLFFSIPGGFIVEYLGYHFLYLATLILLFYSFLLSLKLKDIS